jgi:patatin-like phospholipase/acyl hydrolase
MNRIMSLDGVGVRGILTARLIGRHAAARPGFLAKTDLFAGASTGSILAVGFAMGLPPDRPVRLYLDQGSFSFDAGLHHEVEAVGGLLRSKYRQQARFDGVYPTIGNIKLKDLPSTKVLVASIQNRISC